MSYRILDVSYMVGPSYVFRELDNKNHRMVLRWSSTVFYHRCWSDSGQRITEPVRVSVRNKLHETKKGR